MTCAALEQILCDYIDGTLDAGEREAAERHLTACAGCSSLARDAAAAVKFLERVADVEVPPALVNRILEQVPAKQPAAVRAQAALSRLFGRWLEPVWQPRLVMGMAMTILSFAMLGRFAGIEARQLRPSDLNPVKVWEAAEDKLYRTWTNAVKYYDSLRFIYEIQVRLRELTEPEEDGSVRAPEGQTGGAAPLGHQRQQPQDPQQNHEQDQDQPPADGQAKQKQTQ